MSKLKKKAVKKKTTKKLLPRFKISWRGLYDSMTRKQLRVLTLRAKNKKQAGKLIEDNNSVSFMEVEALK